MGRQPHLAPIEWLELPGLAAAANLTTATSSHSGPEFQVAHVRGESIDTYPAPRRKDANHWFANPTEFGGPRVFMVVGSVPGWLEVALPLKPNGQTSWVNTDDVTIDTVSHRAEVNIEDHRLRVWHGDALIADTPVVVGATGSPTPLGTFYVRDKIRQSNPAGGLGPWALALSGFSEALEHFKGKKPVIALHGTNHPEQVGTSRSNGCVRMPNDIVTELAEVVPLGTPVSIVSGAETASTRSSRTSSAH